MCANTTTKQNSKTATLQTENKLEN